MTQPIKGLLFDKDGTLIDYHLSWGPINHAAIRIASAGDAALGERLYAIGGMDRQSGVTAADSLLAAGHTREIAAAFIAAGSPFEIDELVETFDALFTASAASAVPVTDLETVFAGLRQRGYRLGIASSDSEAAIRRLVDRFDLGGHLDFIAGYDSGHGFKPGPGMVHGFAAAVGLDPSAIAVIGDNLHDMLMGRSAGAGRCVGVLSGTGTRTTLAGLADICLADIGELAAWLDATA